MSSSPPPAVGEARQTVIVCEGYLDRAFWRALLLTLGCRNEHKPGEQTFDPFKAKVDGGQYALIGPRPTDHFIRIVPARAKPNLWKTARNFLLQHATRPIQRMVINNDRDYQGSLPDLEVWKNRAKEFVPVIEHGTILLFNRSLQFHVVDWHDPDPICAGCPDQQTLERLVCAAIFKAYPERAKSVDSWLRTRPNPPEKRSPKEHAWSYMAGWFADHYCEHFYEEVWNDSKIAEALRDKLTRAGHWAIACKVAGVDPGAAATGS